jgi:ubiquinone/menaquinone biosynthesis C-methylase UbiE
MNRANFPWLYEQRLVEPLFKPWAEAMLDRVALAPGARVIDIACGTGIVARTAQRRSGGAARVVGVDASAPMLEVARTIEPSVDWREGDAADLPAAPDERFDWVLCQQGLQFFGDRMAAAREFRRVLAPGGTLLAAVWRSADEMPLFRALQRVAERHLGPIHDERYAFGDEAALERVLREAGFGAVEVITLSIEHRFPAETGLVRMNAMALVGMSGARLEGAERERVLELIVEESAEPARAFTEGDTLVGELRTNLAVARA